MAAPSRPEEKSRKNAESQAAPEGGEKAERRRKLQKLRALGIDPYPHVCREPPGALHGSQAIRRAAAFSLDAKESGREKRAQEPALSKKSSFDPAARPSSVAIRSAAPVAGGRKCTLTGRIRLKRDMGKAAFFNVQDESGSLQCYIRKDDFQEKPQPAVSKPGATEESALWTAKDSKPAAPSPWEIWRLSDIGDIVWLKGFAFHTRRGELSLRVKDFQMLCKSLEPLPEKHHGLEDKELKYRFRHLDLITNPASREIFKTRSRIIREIRAFMHQKGFMEAETPVLQPIYGGAAAVPFVTRHRRLKRDLYLKISPEIYLKKLLVGGFEKVFEIGKNFRNEGIDRSHNPEFTMMEYYEAWTDYQYQMDQFEELVCHIVCKIKGQDPVRPAEAEKGKSFGASANDPQTKNAAAGEEKANHKTDAPAGLKILYQGKELNFERPWARIRVRDFEDLTARALRLPKALKQKTEALLSSAERSEADQAEEAANLKAQKSGASPGANSRKEAGENFCPAGGRGRLWRAVLEELNRKDLRQEIRLIFQGREEGFRGFWTAVQKEMNRQRQNGALKFPDFWRTLRLSEEEKEEKSAAQKPGTALSPKTAGEKSGSLIKESLIKEKPSSKNPSGESSDNSLAAAVESKEEAFRAALFQFVQSLYYVKALDPNFDLRPFENPFPALQDLAKNARGLFTGDHFQDLKNEAALIACELTAESFFHDPIFIMDFPVSLSPLTKKLRKPACGGETESGEGEAVGTSRPSRLVERFEPYIAGMEIGNAYTELNDPEEQEARFQEQKRLADADGGIHPVDENFLHALRTGFPPAGGVGLGAERLVMILTDQKNIRDSILFPVLKSQDPAALAR